MLYDKGVTTLIFYPYVNTGEYVMPSTVKEIGSAVFMDNSNLEGIQFSENLEKIGDGAFQSCTGITDVKLPDTLEEIGETAFFFASNIQNIQLPNRDVVMGSNAFSATGIKSMIFPEGITNIGVASDEETFSVLTMNSALEWVSLPSTLTTFSPLGLFCGSLKTIYSFAPVAPRTLGENAATGTFVIKVPKGSAESYQEAWGTLYPNATFEDVLPAGITVDVTGHTVVLTWEPYADEDFAAPSRYSLKISNATSTVTDHEFTANPQASYAIGTQISGLLKGEYEYELKGYVPTGQMTFLYTGSFEIETSGITEVEAEGVSVAETRYYDMTGREISHPEAGTVCIVRKVMSDGSVSVDKTVID